MTAEEGSHAEGPPRDDVSVTSLAEAVLGRTEVAIFENLYVAYAPQARAVASDILHDPALADDAVHTAFLEMVRYGLGDRRWHEPAQARAAVMRNTRWAALKLLRRRRYDTEAAAAVHAATDVDDATWVRAEARAIADQITHRLTATQRAALHLRFADGLTGPQAAAQLGISVTAFDARLNRALRAARRMARRTGVLSVVCLALRTRLRGTGDRPPAQRRGRPPRARVASAFTAMAVSVSVGTAGVATAELVRAGQGPSAPAGLAGLHLSSLAIGGSSIADSVRLSSGDVVVVAQGTGGCGWILRSTNGGRAWSAMGLPTAVRPGDYIMVSSSAPHTIVVVHGDGSTDTAQAAVVGDVRIAARLVRSAQPGSGATALSFTDGTVVDVPVNVPLTSSTPAWNRAACGP